MAKLVDVYRQNKTLGRRQLQLVVDDNLTMIMDLNASGLLCDNKPVKGKEILEMNKKFKILNEQELKEALTVKVPDVFRMIDEVILCVGCRRSVERLHMQLWTDNSATIDPLFINNNGAITFRPDKNITALDLATLFQGHSARLNKLIELQPRRSKKSNRCLLHSLDSQRSRPITPVWREVWDVMRQQCKDEVVLIEASTLHATLENYLRKHRFCGECRTKVLKAYSLLVEEPDPSKEKGYVSALYSGIKRCLPDKHLHLQTKTEYIHKLIARAEPELLGSRRERHAKTLEIAQEEVLTCLGICVYERLHKIYVRMREEECTCQMFAAIAVDALCRSFETAIEKKQGISQLELLYEELTKEEQIKQQRKEQKKLKRKKRKEKNQNPNLNSNLINDLEEKENCLECQEMSSDSSVNKELICRQNNLPISKKGEEDDEDESLDNCKSCHKLEIETKNNNNFFPKGSKGSLIEKDTCLCPKNGKSQHKDSWSEKRSCSNQKEQFLNEKTTNYIEKEKQTPATCSQNGENFFEKDDIYCEDENWLKMGSCHVENDTKCNFEKTAVTFENISENSNHDCGYASENNFCENLSGQSSSNSLPSSPEGSEMACSGSCCNLHLENNHNKFAPCGQLSLQQMLEDSCTSDEDNIDSFLTPEEVREFKEKICNSKINEKRQELRQILRKRFIQLCVNGTTNQK